MGSRIGKKPSVSLQRNAVATLFLVIVFLCFLCVVGVFVIVREGYTEIQEIQVQGNTVVQDSEIRRVVQSLLSEKCFLYARCGYGVWVPSERIIEGLRSGLARIDDVSVQYESPHRMIVNVSERTVAWRFCTDNTQVQCYFVDSSGVLFERAPVLSDLRYIPTVFPDSSKILVSVDESQIPLQLWSAESVQEFQSILALVEPYGRVYRIVYSRRDANVEVDKLYGYLIARDTAVLKFNRESMHDKERVMYMDASLERLNTFKPFVDKFKASPNSLEYLDLRFVKRLYMKFESAENDQPETIIETP